MSTIDAKRLETLIHAIFIRAGLNDEEARRVARSLVLSDLKGHASHGAMRVGQYTRSLKSGDY